MYVRLCFSTICSTASMGFMIPEVVLQCTMATVLIEGSSSQCLFNIHGVGYDILRICQGAAGNVMHAGNGGHPVPAGTIHDNQECAVPWDDGRDDRLQAKGTASLHEDSRVVGRRGKP